MELLSKEPLKGMLDDLPEEMASYKWMKQIIDKVANKFSYREYDAPVIEPIEIFARKSSEELLKEQSYNFTDRGGRDVILRPEITPSLARLVSKVVKEQPRPFRWYSVPKCYRYERPQKGRLREFRQLNFDLMGEATLISDLEIFRVIIEMMKSFGVSNDKYVIYFNSRKLIDTLLSEISFSVEEKKSFYGLIDRKNKMSPEDFEANLSENFPEKSKKNLILDYLRATSVAELISIRGLDPSASSALSETLVFEQAVSQLGLQSRIVFSPSTVRGLDYYTGIVFEVYDKSGALGRALFGGGRFDNLVKNYTDEAISGIGFGMGIYIFSLFLEALGLMPKVKFDLSEAFYIVPMDSSTDLYAVKIADTLIAQGKTAEISFSKGNLKKQFQKAEQKGYGKIIIVGSDEMAQNIYTLKDLKTGTQTTEKI